MCDSEHGVCLAAFQALTIALPDAAANLAAPFTVQASLTRAPGSLADPPESVTLIARREPYGDGETLARDETFALPRVPDSLDYRADVLPAGMGSYTLKVASAERGLVSSPVVVNVESNPSLCGNRCNPFDECVDGKCLAAFSSVVLSAPGDGTTVGASVPVTAILTRRAGSLRDPPQWVTLMTKAAGATSYEAAVTLFPSAPSSETYTGVWNPPSSLEHVAYSLVAKTEAVAELSAAVNVLADTLAPAFTLEVAPAPTRSRGTVGERADELDPQCPVAWSASLPYRRDEQATVLVRSTDTDVDASTLVVRVQGATGSGSKDFPTTDCVPPAAGFCRQANVPLGDPALEMSAFRGDFTASATGKDVAGNGSAVASTTIHVTRWKWVFNANAGFIKTAPAIGSEGTIYFGTSQPKGTAFAVNPDGSKRGIFTTNAPIQASLAVGTIGGAEAVFLAGSDNNNYGTVWALDGKTFAPRVVCQNTTDTGSAVGSLALTTTSFVNGVSTATVFAGIQTTFGTNLCAVRPEYTDPNTKCTSAPLAKIHSAFPNIAPDSGFAIQPSAKATDVYFGDDRGNLQSFTLNPIGLSTNWDPQPLTNLNLATNPVVTGSGIAGGGGSANGQFFAFSASGTAVTPFATPNPVWNAVESSSGLLLAGSGTSLLGVKEDLSQVVLNIDLSAPVRGAPAIGADGTVHIATGSSSFFALKGDGSTLWRVDGVGRSESSPALDCTRTSAGEVDCDTVATTSRPKPGVVYVADNDGNLYAFVTDSRGIDTKAPWPKFHRDPRNSADAARPLSEFRLFPGFGDRV